MRGRGRHILNGTRTFQWIGSMDRWHGGWREAARVPASPIFFYICEALHHHGWHQTSASLPFQLRLGKSNSPRILQAFYTWTELLRHLISWLRNLVLCSAHHWFTQPLIEYRKQTTEIHETNIFGGKVYSWKQKCTQRFVWLEQSEEGGQVKQEVKELRDQVLWSLRFWETMVVNCEGHENPWDGCEQMGTLNTLTMGVVMI